MYLYKISATFIEAYVQPGRDKSRFKVERLQDSWVSCVDNDFFRMSSA